MSDMPATDAKAAAEITSADGAKAGGATAPARPAAEIRADIERERSELNRSFESLRKDLDEAVDAGKLRARAAGKKAAVIAPVVAGLVASAAAIRLLVRRRSAKDE